MRRLLLSGDNTLKNRDDLAGAERARARYTEALAVAQGAGLDAELVEIIRRRIPPTDVA